MNDHSAELALARALDDPGTGVWEPWSPKVGDRVEIHRSAECLEQYEFTHAEHLADGARGEVVQVFPDAFGMQTGDGHDYLVKFGEDAEGRWDTSYFAAAELIPLAAPPADATAEGQG